MSSEVAIQVTDLSKCYHIYNRPQDRLKQALLPKIRQALGKTSHPYYTEFWALRDISFEVHKGETVGILGRNGSGKSTLLQMICGTLHPSSGQIETQGRIAALLELGSGFNPEFSGRENVFLNGALLGMSSAEIESRFDDIASFADIGSHMEQPVKTYSSGMYVRLAFAVNIMSQPEIMVVDEALAVGDMTFQAKCMTALSRIQDNGATVLFVSHDIGSVRGLCSHALYLEKGQLRHSGPAADVASRYVKAMREEMSEESRRFSRVSGDFESPHGNVPTSPPAIADTSSSFKISQAFAERVALHRYGTGGLKVTEVELLNSEGFPSDHIEFNEEVTFRIHVESGSTLPVSIGFSLFDEKSINIVGCGFGNANRDMLAAEVGGCYVVDYKLKLPLKDGRYSIGVQITTPLPGGNSADFIDVIENALVFRVNIWSQSRIWSKVHLFPSLTVTQIPAQRGPTSTLANAQ